MIVCVYAKLADVGDEFYDVVEYGRYEDPKKVDYFVGFGLKRRHLKR